MTFGSLMVLFTRKEKCHWNIRCTKEKSVVHQNEVLRETKISIVFVLYLVRIPAESPGSSSSSVSSSEPSVAKSPPFKPPFPAHLRNGSPTSDSHALSSSFSSHPLYGPSGFSPFNCLPPNTNINNNSNGFVSSSRDHNNEQQHQNLLHDRLLLQMAAASRQQQQLSFDGHPQPPNGLWRPSLRPFLGKH